MRKHILAGVALVALGTHFSALWYLGWFVLGMATSRLVAAAEGGAA